MNELITFKFYTQKVSARELHKALGIEKRFSAWFETNSQGFLDNEETDVTVDLDDVFGFIIEEYGREFRLWTD